LVLYGKDAWFSLQKSGIEDYLVYLEEIELSIEKQNIKMEKQAQEVSEEDLEEYWYHIEKTNGISINQSDVILLETIFCEEFAEIVISFLTKTYKGITDKEKKHHDLK